MKRFRIRIEYGEFENNHCNGVCNAAAAFLSKVFLLSVQVRRILIRINIDLDCISTLLCENCCMISMYQLKRGDISSPVKWGCFVVKFCAK